MLYFSADENISRISGNLVCLIYLLYIFSFWRNILCGRFEAQITNHKLKLHPKMIQSLFNILGGVTVAKTLRTRRYVTMVDPYQVRYGNNMGVLLLLLHVTGDLFFSAATLLALGTTVSVVIGLDLILSTIVSEIVVVVYTLFGGIRSVAYTDVVQLPCILLGLVSYNLGISQGISFCAAHHIGKALGTRLG